MESRSCISPCTGGFLTLSSTHSSRDTKPNQTKPNQIKLNQTKQNKTKQTKLNQTKKNINIQSADILCNKTSWV